MNLATSLDFEAHDQQEAEHQAKLIAKFGLPVQAKNVALFSQPCKEPYSDYFKGLLKWELPGEELKKQARVLGPSPFDYVTWALQGE